MVPDRSHGGHWRIVAAFILAVSISAPVLLWLLQPRQPDIPAYDGLKEQERNYRPGGSKCEPEWLNRPFNWKAPDERERCAEAKEEHRLKANDLIQQARSANASEAVARLTFDQTRIGVAGTILGAITMFAAIFAAWFAGRAAVETERTAVAAESALALAEKAEKRQLRSYVFVKEAIVVNGGFFTEFIASVKIRNYGQTPARRMLLRARLSFCTEEEINNITPYDCGEPILDADLAPGGEFEIDLERPAFTDGEFAEMKIAGCKVYLHGTIVYFDAFGVYHTGAFRYEHTGKVELGQTKAMKLSTAGNTGFGAFEADNEAD